MKNLQNLFFLVFLISCSSTTISTIKDGEFIVTDGRYNELIWNEDLIFHRTTWFYELSVLYDFFIAELPVNSNYRRWFTSSESISANNCAKFYIAGAYTSNDQRVNSNDIWNSFDTNKVKFSNVNGFYRHLSFSSKFITNSLASFKFWGICVKNIDEKIDVQFAFPGFPTKQIVL